MPAQGKRGRYHHGDLRAATIETAVELVREDGARGFSLAEVSRRLGVAPSAPYAHFADREELLAAIAVRGYRIFGERVSRALRGQTDPADRLAALAAAYVRFAGRERSLFELLFVTSVDMRRHPEVKRAEAPLAELLQGALDAIPGADDRLGVAVEASAHGHALMLLNGDWEDAARPIETAAASAAAATRALIAGREALASPGG